MYVQRGKKAWQMLPLGTGTSRAVAPRMGLERRPCAGRAMPAFLREISLGTATFALGGMR